MAKITSRKTLETALSGADPLAALAHHGALTASGSAWVKMALDPFHDYEIQGLQGVPDLETEPSLIVRTQQSTVVTNNVSSDAWDCNICQMPVDFSRSNKDQIDPSTVNMVTCNYSPLGDATSAPGFAEVNANVPNGSRMDGLQFSLAPAGANTFQNLGGPLAQHGLALDDYVYSGSNRTDLVVYRVLSSGFEVVNTTQALSKQGAVTVYELGQPGEVTQIATLNAGSVGAPLTETRSLVARNFRAPPKNMREAKQLPGSRTWMAEDGCYVVGKHRSEMSYSCIAKRDFVYAQSDENGVSWMPHKAGINTANTETSVPFGAPKEGAASHISNMNMCGAYFSGLSPETTLEVTWRCTLERLPGPMDLQNLALASPSAQYDPAALELYSHICSLLPPGVPVGYNDAGKYFRMIASTIRKAAKFTLPLLPAFEGALASSGNPIAAAGVGGLELVSKALIKKKAAQERKRAVPNMGKPLVK